MNRCPICQGSMREGAAYTAYNDAETELVKTPSVECEACGYIQPDADRIDDASKDVPSSVRIRCAEIRDERLLPPSLASVRASKTA